MLKKMVLLSLVFCLAAFLTAGGVKAEDTIKIGFHAPLTGFAASDGKSATTGAELAVEQINAAAE